MSTHNNTPDNNWDTEEIAMIIANDEGLYLMCNEYAEHSRDIRNLAEMIEADMIDIIPTIEYCRVDIDEIDWYDVAEDIMEGLEYGS